MNYGVMTLLFSLFIICFIYDLACSPMLVDALAEVIASILERVFMLDSEFMPLLSEIELTETIKTCDVLLLLGIKQRCLLLYVVYIAYITHHAYCNYLLLAT